MIEFEEKIAAAYRAMAESGALDKTITTHVEKTVQEVVRSATSSFSDFGKSVETAVKEALQIDVQRLGLPGYNEIVLGIVKRTLDQQIDLVGKQYLEESLHKLLSAGAPKEIKLSGLVNEFKQWAREDFDNKDRDGEITAILTESSYSSRTLYLDAKADQEKYRCRFSLMWRDESGEIFHITISGKDPQKHILIGDFSGFDRTLFHLYASKSRLVVDTEHPDIYQPDQED